MTNKPKKIGTAAETAVARAAHSRGFPMLERRSLKGSGGDCGDLVGYPRICWQVKGGNYARDASDLDIENWMAAMESQRVNAGADIGLLVVQRRGVGDKNAHRWWAYMWSRDLAADHLMPNFPVRMLFEDALRWLCAAGYGSEEPGTWIEKAS